jgi:hypothetical protein
VEDLERKVTGEILVRGVKKLDDDAHVRDIFFLELSEYRSLILF